MISHAFSTFHEHGKNFAVLYYLVSIRCLDQGGERFLVESDRSRFIGPWTAPSIAFQILGIEQSFELDFQSRKKISILVFWLVSDLQVISSFVEILDAEVSLKPHLDLRDDCPKPEQAESKVHQTMVSYMSDASTISSRSTAKMLGHQLQPRLT